MYAADRFTLGSVDSSTVLPLRAAVVFVKVFGSQAVFLFEFTVGLQKCLGWDT